MRFSVLGSGSRGNCVYIEHEQTAILIDGGFSGKQIAARLQSIGRDIDDITAICVTHEHNDHIAGVGVLSRRCKLPIYANPGTFQGGEKRLGKLHVRREFSTGDTLEIQDLQVRSFPVSHDTADPVGYVISNGTVHLGYCTDTGKVSKLMQLRLACCHGLILEFNHNLEMLKNGPYPLPLQQRVRSSQGHLANEDAADLLQQLQHRNLKYGVLAHLSDTNNTPGLALAAAQQTIEHGSETELVLASQDRPTSLLSL
jgi:phosphoribosyl 1,2-cyclic phosphodiesterase